MLEHLKATNPQQANLKEHEAIHNPTILFRGLTALNGSVTSASMNATLLNHFREEDNTDQTYNQEGLEYENTLRALEQDILK